MGTGAFSILRKSLNETRDAILGMSQPSLHLFEFLPYFCQLGAKLFGSAGKRGGRPVADIGAARRLDRHPTFRLEESHGGLCSVLRNVVPVCQLPVGGQLGTYRELPALDLAANDRSELLTRMRPGLIGPVLI